MATTWTTTPRRAAIAATPGVGPIPTLENQAHNYYMPLSMSFPYYSSSQSLQGGCRMYCNPPPYHHHHHHQNHHRYSSYLVQDGKATGQMQQMRKNTWSETFLHSKPTQVASSAFLSHSVFYERRALLVSLSKKLIELHLNLADGGMKMENISASCCPNRV